MLCTLLIINAGALETLPIILEELMSPTAAIIVSVIVVLVFCEIIPMSLCTGPNQLKIAEYCCPIVNVCMYATGILSWPIGKLMDCAVGHGGQQKFENFEMRYLIKKHVDQALDNTLEMSVLNNTKSAFAAPVDSYVDQDSKGRVGISKRQMYIYDSAFNLQDSKMKDVMIDQSNFKYSLNLDTQITQEELQKMQKDGHSLVPVVGDKKQVIGTLVTKALLGATLD